jgi:hypothetical protein
MRTIAACAVEWCAAIHAGSAGKPATEASADADGIDFSEGLPRPPLGGIPDAPQQTRR